MQCRLPRKKRSEIFSMLHALKINKGIDGWMDGWIDGWIYGRMEREREKER